MKIDGDSSTIAFASTEVLLDAFVAFSVRLSVLGSETADDPIQDVTYLQARKFFWEAWFYLQRLLRHEHSVQMRSSLDNIPLTTLFTVCLW